MGKKTRRTAKTQAKASRQRVEESLRAANALGDPIDGLDSSLLSFDLPAVAASAGERDPAHDTADSDTDADTADDVRAPARPRRARIRCHRSPLPEDLQSACLDMFERNMGDMYRSSSWGLDLKKKETELRHEKARFLIVTEEVGGREGGEEGGDNGKAAESRASTPEDDTKPRVLAFCHFRFEPDDDDRPKEEVLYLFEIQIHASAQRCGMGRRLMSVMEMVALRTKMRKVVLTVFKTNESAMGFYLKKMKYGVDNSSPSKFGEDADYEILSKRTQTS